MSKIEIDVFRLLEYNMRIIYHYKGVISKITPFIFFEGGNGMRCCKPGMYWPAQPGFFANLSEYQERKPEPDAPDAFFGNISFFYEMSIPHQDLFSIPIIPDGCMDIIFIMDGNSVVPYVIGTATTLVGLDAYSTHSIFGIRFTPGGIQHFFPLDAKEISSTQVELGTVITGCSEMADRLLESNGFESRIQCVEKYLHSKLRPIKNKNEILQYCVQNIVDSLGSCTVRYLEEQTGYSARYINRLFCENIGFSPKIFCEIVRLQSAVSGIISSTNRRLCDISACCGYYDQSHMNRSCEKFLHVTAGYLTDKDFFHANRQNLVKAYHM